MSWIPFAIGGWLVLSVAAGLAIGLSIRLADRRDAGEAPDVALERPPVAPGAGTPAWWLDRRSAGPADLTRNSRLPVVRGCLPAPERRPSRRRAGRR